MKAKFRYISSRLLCSSIRCGFWVPLSGEMACKTIFPSKSDLAEVAVVLASISDPLVFLVGNFLFRLRTL